MHVHSQADVLLEREHELKRVRAALGAARGHAGRSIVIEGAAGIRKSQLLLEAERAYAADLGVRVLAARATELGHGTPGSTGCTGSHRTCRRMRRSSAIPPPSCCAPPRCCRPR